MKASNKPGQSVCATHKPRSDYLFTGQTDISGLGADAYECVSMCVCLCVCLCVCVCVLP